MGELLVTESSSSLCVKHMFAKLQQHARHQHTDALYQYTGFADGQRPRLLAAEALATHCSGECAGVRVVGGAASPGS